MRTIDTSPAELRALADKLREWDRCYPGNCNVDMLASYAEDALRALAAEKEAAPGMLAALKATEEASAASVSASKAVDGGKIPKPIWDELDGLFRRAETLRRAAIAKAEGRS